MPRIPLVTEASMTDAQRRVYDAMMWVPADRRRWDRLPPRCTAPISRRNGPTWASCCASLELRAAPARVRHSAHRPVLGLPVRVVLARGGGAQGRPVRATIETLRHGGGTFAAADEQSIHDYAIELLRDHHAGDATYKRILDAYGTAGIVELTALIGYYAMVALTLNAHEIGVPEGATPPLPALPGHRAAD